MEPKPRRINPQDFEPVNPQKSRQVLPGKEILMDHATGTGGGPGLPTRELVTKEGHKTENPYIPS